MQFKHSGFIYDAGFLESSKVIPKIWNLITNEKTSGKSYVHLKILNCKFNQCVYIDDGRFLESSKVIPKLRSWIDDWKKVMRTLKIKIAYEQRYS